MRASRASSCADWWAMVCSAWSRSSNEASRSSHHAQPVPHRAGTASPAAAHAAPTGRRWQRQRVDPCRQHATVTAPWQPAIGGIDSRCKSTPAHSQANCPRAVAAQQLDPRGSAIGEHVGLALCRGPMHRRLRRQQQQVDAAAQVRGRGDQPPALQAQHAPSARSSPTSHAGSTCTSAAASRRPGAAARWQPNQAPQPAARAAATPRRGAPRGLWPACAANTRNWPATAPAHDTTPPGSAH